MTTTTSTKPTATTTEPTSPTPAPEASVTSVTAGAVATKYVINSAGAVSEVPADWKLDPAEFKEATAAQIDAYKKATAPGTTTPAPATTTTKAPA